jgi:predicted phage gp36 major capsid-like protein
MKVPGMIGGALDKRADQIRNELEQAKKLREEAQQLLAEYQRKRKEAEAEAESILSAAEKEAAILRDEAKAKTEEYVSRRTAMAEQKIQQARGRCDQRGSRRCRRSGDCGCRKPDRQQGRRQGIRRPVQGIAWRSEDTSQLRFSLQS